MRTHAYTLVAVIAGCVTSRPVMTPSGQQGHYIECPRSIDICMDKAAELCPRGYDVIGSGGREGAIAQTNYYTGQTVVTPTFRGNMTVQCRAPGPAPAQSAAPVAASGAACAPLKGIYAVRHELRDGDCGPVRETLMTLDIRDGGKIVVADNGCAVYVDSTAPQSGEARAMRVKAMLRLDQEGSRATGVEEWILSPGPGPGCSGTYSVTYTRQ